MRTVRQRMRWVLAVVGCGGLLALGSLAFGEEEGPREAKPETLAPIVQQSPPAGPPASLLVVQTAKGAAVADQRGFVLYIHNKDKVDKDGTAVSSACVKTCATTWPPALVESGMPMALPGIDPRTLDIMVRPDGGKQITLSGRPLYHHVGDSLPGQPTGDGVDGVWKIARPS